MVLVQRTITPEEVVLVFRGNDEGKTVEQLLIEAICSLTGRLNLPVSSWALHFCSLHHPFSSMQRLRELSKQFKEYRRQGGPQGLEAYVVKESMEGRRRHFYYHFQPEFIDWLKRMYHVQEPADVPAR